MAFLPSLAQKFLTRVFFNFCPTHTPIYYILTSLFYYIRGETWEKP